MLHRTAESRSVYGPPFPISWVRKFLGLAALAMMPAGASAVELHANTDVATAGYFQLTWTSDGPVELVESPDPAFSSSRLVYAGPDRATVLSGKPDGSWFYRARRTGMDAPGPWGGALEVTVRHHGLGRAFIFFAIGGAVFGMTALLIVSGSRSPA